MPKIKSDNEMRTALTAAWERFSAEMGRIRNAVRGVMNGIDDRRRTKEIEEVRKKLNEL